MATKTEDKTTEGKQKLKKNKKNRSGYLPESNIFTNDEKVFIELENYFPLSTMTTNPKITRPLTKLNSIK